MVNTKRSGATIATGVLLAAAMLSGCQSNLKDQNAYLIEENEGLRAQLVERNQVIEAQEMELRDRDERIAALQGDLDVARRTPVAAAPADVFGGIAGVTGSYGAGEVTATVESDVLFDSGKATLKPSARRSLDQVARILTAEYGDKTIRVAGHTDTDPIRKSGFKSNHHLGFERAYAVRAYLIKQGVAPSNIYVASHGPTRAMTSKSASRRVEIAVVLNE